MEFNPVDLLLHFDDYLADLINLVGPFTYVVLFIIVFAETGLVVTPFLPGDSLLFVVGTLSGSGYLNFWISYFTLLSAAIIGDTVNYWIGHKIGPKVFSQENSLIFKKAYLEKTREFYEKHGKKTIILARFAPIVRTFAPFVAGVGKMHYQTFFFYNVIGAFIWVTSLLFAGYFFGSLPWVKANFEYIVYFIIIISLLPMVIEYIQHKRGPRLSKEQMSHANYKELEKTVKETDK